MSDLLPLATEPFEPVPSPREDLGDRGELEWLAIDSLCIDPRYQRQVLDKGRKNIRHIIEHFSWARFSPLVVAKRGKQFAVIDGQHRAIAAALHGGIDKLPCLIIKADAEEEAIAFATINGQVTAVLPTQIFYARLAGGEVKALALKEVCDRAGVTVLRSPKPKPKAGETSAVTTLETCLKKFGPDVLVTTLQAITQTGDGNAGYLTAPIVEGTCEALAMNERWRNAGQELFTAVEKASIPRLYNLAIKDRTEQKGVSVRAVFAEAMKAALTKALGTDKKGSAAEKPVDGKLLSTNARDVLLILSDFPEAISASEVAELSEASADRIPGLLTSLAQMGCARATAGKWELTAKGRATADVLKASEAAR